MRKGSQCAVVGRIQIEQYTDRDGNTRYSTDIVAQEVEFLGSPAGGGGSYDQGMSVDDMSEPMDSSFPVVDDEDIPF